MKILQVIDNFINLDEVIKIVIETNKNNADTVDFIYKDTRGDWYTSSLKRKDSFIAEPLTPEMIKGAFIRSVQYLEAEHGIANLADFLDEEEEIPDDED